MDEMFEGPAGAIADVPLVRNHLIAAARRGEPVSYAELLIALGHRFTRPKMRALCKTLDAIDEAGRAAGEPELAVLVVRESDGLPGQGWWTNGPPQREDYTGLWTGPDAMGFVRELQGRCFDHWAAPRPRRAKPAAARASAVPSRTSRPR